MDNSTGKMILELKRRIEEDFTYSDWEELGLLTDSSDIIDGHNRLLRSLNFGDEDYSGNIIDVLKTMAQKDINILSKVKSVLSGIL